MMEHVTNSILEVEKRFLENMNSVSVRSYSYTFYQLADLIDKKAVVAEDDPVLLQKKTCKTLEMLLQTAGAVVPNGYGWESTTGILHLIDATQYLHIFNFLKNSERMPAYIARKCLRAQVRFYCLETQQVSPDRLDTKRVTIGDHRIKELAINLGWYTLPLSEKFGI